MYSSTLSSYVSTAGCVSAIIHADADGKGADCRMISKDPKWGLLQPVVKREVVDIATRERKRLSTDLHEGLGQDLTGIAMLIEGLGMGVERGRPVPRSALTELTAQVNRMIGVTRDMASSLSPTQVVRGSLSSERRGEVSHSARQPASRRGNGGSTTSRRGSLQKNTAPVSESRSPARASISRSHAA